MKRHAVFVLASLVALASCRTELLLVDPPVTGQGGSGDGSGQPIPCASNCAAMAPACRIGSCDEPTGICVFKRAPDGDACDDGDACTVADRCEAGACVAEINDCGGAPTPDECHVPTCDRDDGVCKPIAGNDGGPCSAPAPDECHVMRCAAGSCGAMPGNDGQPCGGAPPDDCHVMRCGSGQCVAVAGNDGTSCAVADKCTVGALCNAGTCGGKPKDCSALDSGPVSAACQVGACDVASGGCVTAAAKDGTACSTGSDYCAGEACTAGKCGPGVGPISQCKGGDKCCPLACSAKNDGDCDTALATGGFFTCARLGSGRVECWGNNALGGFGDGTETSSLTPVDVGLANAVGASASYWSSCVVLGNGTVRCACCGAAPALVPGIGSAIAVAHGGNHICALLADGTVRCWGANSNGELGDGSNVPSQTPVAVKGISDAVAISSGAVHTCAVTKSGAVTCWGANWYGQLGDGTTNSSSVPVTLAMPSGVSAVACGRYHSCARLADGTVRCWGSNDYGQLGNGTGVDSAAPVQAALADAASIAAGEWHSCALMADRTVRCWGNNDYGQLGNGSAVALSAKPVLVLLGGALAVASGFASGHTCALLAGGIRCWGDNNSGQLGNGTTKASSVPVAVKGW